MIVYLILNKVNLKGYVGQHVGTKISTRWQRDFKGANISFKRDYEEYGSQVFDREILNVCSSAEEMDTLEKLWVTTLRTYDPEFGYNKTMGGRGTLRWDRKRIHITNEVEDRWLEFGSTIPDGWRRGTRCRRFGLMWITNGIQNSQIPTLSDIPSGWRRGVIHSKHKNPRSLEERQNISKRMKNRPGNDWTEEQRDKLSKTIRGVPKHGLSQKGTIRITNGTDNRKMFKDQPIPNGWWRGLTLRKAL